jgi:hypothetical protein
VSLIEKSKSEYSQQVRDLLSIYPKELEVFEDLWGSGKLREAYIFVIETAERLTLKRSAENMKADEDFFWTYMH